MKKWLLILIMLLAVTLALPALADSDHLSFDKSVTELFAGETLQTVLRRSGGAAEGDVTYKSSAEHIGTVDDNGLVTGVGRGRVLITATVKNGKRTYTASISLVVNVKAETVSLKTENLSVFAADDPVVASLAPEGNELPVLILPLGRNLTLSGDVQPATTNDRTVIYTSSDEEILQIQQRAARPKKAGLCTLTLSSRQNPEVTQSWLVIVSQPVKTVKLTASADTLYVGDIAFLFAEITPDDATFPAVSWKSMDEKVLTVDDDGTVTAVGKGSTHVRATALDGSEKIANIQVRVKQQPEAITLNETDTIFFMGSPRYLKAAIAPNICDERALVWSSSDERVATVSDEGRVVPVAVGDCVITVRSKAFPGVYAACQVHVHQQVTKVKFTSKNPTVNVGESISLLWETEPATATNPAVKFTSSNKKIATVDQQGNVTGVKRGVCTITATAQDGSGRKGSIKVTVLQPVTGVHMYSDTIRVGVGETEYGRAVLEPSDASNNRMVWYSENEDVATVTGNRNKPAIHGREWGETTIVGTTEDGGYTTSATVKVGNFDRAVVITDLYLQDNRIKISVANRSNMTITRITYRIEVYDMQGNPLPCTKSGDHAFNGSYGHILYEGESTRHGKFYFPDFVQPEESIGRVVMTITGYTTDEGYRRSIREERQIPVEFVSDGYEGEENWSDDVIIYH